MTAGRRQVRQENNRRRVAGFCLLLVPMLVACGKKGPPRPPLARFPVQAAAPLARQAGDRLEVRIPLPALAASGDAVESLAGLKIYRIERPLGDSGAPPAVTSRDFPDTLKSIRTIEGEEAISLMPGGVLIHREAIPTAGKVGRRGFAYAIRFRGVGRAWSPTFTAAVVVPAPNLAAPASLSASVEPGGVRLTWPPTEDRVAVFRGQVGKPLGFLPLDVVEAGLVSYLDESVAADATYQYALRFVVGEPAGHAYGAATAPVSVAVLDTFAPEPPEGVAVLARIGGVDLFWQAGDEDDLAGYRVWRRAFPDGPWQVATTALLTQTNWSDVAVVEGARYLYAVTAVDRAVPPNESDRSAVEQVSVPFAAPGDAAPGDDEAADAGAGSRDSGEPE